MWKSGKKKWKLICAVFNLWIKDNTKPQKSRIMEKIKRRNYWNRKQKKITSIQ